MIRSENVDEELVVISTLSTSNTIEPTVNTNEPTANNTDESAKNNRQSVNKTQKSFNSAKQLTNSTKESVNETKESTSSTKESANSTKESASSTKHSDNRTEPSANSTDPIIFGTRYVETDFTGRLSELASLNSFFQQPQLPTSMARICVVAGMNGIGKTQLVSKFIVENRSSYQNVIWIDAECSQSINDSFRKLAEKINPNGDRRDAKSAIKEVFNRFCEKNTLFVYDNVGTVESIKFALIRTSSVEGPHVLITSLVDNWDDRIKVIKMQAWITNDAVEFVFKKLNNFEDRQADIVLLVNELNCIPLALRLATAYIMYQRAIFARYEISDYLSAIKCQSPNDGYEKPIFITSTIAISAIQKNQTRGILAIKMLNIIAYFAPNNIQREERTGVKSIKWIG